MAVCGEGGGDGRGNGGEGGKGGGGKGGGGKATCLLDETAR
jgi:hypothetical protein